MECHYTKILLIPLFFGVMIGCGGVTPNATVTFELSGPCISCPSDTAVKIVQSLHGIAEVSYDEKEHNLTVQFDSTLIKKGEIIVALNENGYEVDLETFTSAKIYPSCCDFSEEEALDLDLDDDDLDLLELDMEFDNMDITAEIENLEKEADEILDQVQIDDEDLKDLNLDD